MSLCSQTHHSAQVHIEEDIPNEYFEDSDVEENDSDGAFDLAEKPKYKNCTAKTRTRKRKERQELTRLAKLFKKKPECSQHELLTRAIHDYVKLLFGIPRKRKGHQSHYMLPLPPSDAEYREWYQRKSEQQKFIKRSILDARSRYLRKNPLAIASQLVIVENLAAEKALSKREPAEFISQVVLRNGHIGYSISVAYTCERALALAGFQRLAYDWLHSAKSTWNESVLTIISEEWEKCHRRGAAEDYDINVKLVTSKNTFQILERWFNTKSREYMSQCTEEDNGVDPAVAKEKQRQKASQKRVSFLISKYLY